MKYRAKNSFSTGKLNFQKFRVYDEIPEGYEGYFDNIPDLKETTESVKAKKRSKSIK